MNPRYVLCRGGAHDNGERWPLERSARPGHTFVWDDRDAGGRTPWFLRSWRRTAARCGWPRRWLPREHTLYRACRGKPAGTSGGAGGGPCGSLGARLLWITAVGGGTAQQNDRRGCKETGPTRTRTRHEGRTSSLSGGSRTWTSSTTGRSCASCCGVWGTIFLSAEVIAEVFVVAWRRLDELPDPVLPWLYGAARRVLANEFRHQSRLVAAARAAGGARGRRATRTWPPSACGCWRRCTGSPTPTRRCCGCRPGGPLGRGHRGGAQLLQQRGRGATAPGPSTPARAHGRGCSAPDDRQAHDGEADHA